jgi:hypothetical protein
MEKKQFCGMHYDPDELDLYIGHLNQCLRLRGNSRQFDSRYYKILLEYPEYTVAHSGICRWY